MLVGLGGTAKSLSFAHVRVHRRPVHRPLVFGISKVHRLVHDLQFSHFLMAGLLKLQVLVPQNENAYSRSHLSFFGPLPHFSPGRRGAGSSSQSCLIYTFHKQMGITRIDFGSDSV